MKKSKFIVVIFYGVVAVGKYTVASEFQKQTGYKFFHNHHTHDLVRELFERGTLGMDRLTERLRFAVFEEIAEAGINVVSTHTYANGFVSKTGISEFDYLNKVRSIIENKGGKVYFVHLVAEPEIIIKRVKGESRHNFMKLKDEKIMAEILKNEKIQTGLNFENHIEVNNTKLAPKEVVEKVLKEIDQQQENPDSK